MPDVILMYIRQYLNMVLSTIEWIGLEGPIYRTPSIFPWECGVVGFKFPLNQSIEYYNWLVVWNIFLCSIIIWESSSQLTI